ncbi:MAG TPA: tetratricopeptide repeat protein, partial [Tepidisphaeraceae bacterium]|nr:tetratricopeptide repeat protein [Tepidisphaeraceae bacterium]
DAEVEYLKGIVAQHWMKLDEALRHYNEASALKPEDLAYLLAQAETLVLLGREDDAMRVLIDRSTYFEHSAPIRDAIGQLYEQRGQMAEAVEYFRQASVLDPEDDAIRERLALAFYRVNRHRDALSQLNRLLAKPELAARADLQVLAGECRFNQSQTVEARDAFEAAARSDSSLVEAWQGVARSSLALNDVRRASLALKKASAVDPDNASTWLLIGYTKMREGDTAGAFESFGRAATLDSSDPVAVTMMGLLFQRNGMTDRAINLYGRALAISPKDELAQKLMADVSK